MSSTNNILMVLTSHAELGTTGEATGFWLEEFAAPYYAFVDAGFNVTLASPKGGQPPLDPKSKQADFQTASTERFNQDQQAQAALAQTAVLAEQQASDFAAVFYPGGHGPLWDLVDNTDSIALLEAFIAANKPIAAVCHASAAFLKLQQNGAPLIKGKAVTGFSNSEEAAVGLTDIVPFLLEDEIAKQGADYQKAEDWNAFAVQDGVIISGQNPASSELVAQKLIQQLN